MSAPKSSATNTVSGDELGQSLSNLKTSLYSFVDKIDATCAEVEGLLNEINDQVGLITSHNTPSQSKRVIEILKYGNQTSPVDSRVPGHRCFLCNAVATQKCEICFQTNASQDVDIPYYCGEDHQNLHLTLGHNSFCGKDALKLGWKEIRDTEGINNGLPFYVATRKLEAGEEIFSKKPLFTFPRNSDKQDRFAFRSKFPELFFYMGTRNMSLETCIICHEMMVYGQLMEDPLYGIRLNKCPSCEWPVHSSRDVNIQKVKMTLCQEEHEKECKIFMDNHQTWDKINKSEGTSWLFLGALRAILNPVLRQKLLKLRVSGSCSFRGIDKFVIEKCKQFQVSVEDLNKLLLAIVSNFLPSYAGYFSMWKKYNCTVYEGGHTGRILPHACNPNCSVHVNPKTGEAIFKTRCKVEKDEMLTISYMVDSFPQPIHYRALSLMRHNVVDHCHCRRCKDGKDITSAVKYVHDAKSKKHKKHCNSQYLKPYLTRPQENKSNKSWTSNQNQPSNASKYDQVNRDPADLYVWECESCKSLGPSIQQSDVHKKVDLIRGQIIKTIPGGEWDKLKEIIEKCSDKELHPEHCLMLLARVTYFYITIENMRRMDISKDESLSLDYTNFPVLDKAIEILKRNYNGRSEMYGTLLYYHTLLEMSRLADKISTSENKPNVSEMQRALEPIMNNLKESWEIIMKDNPYLSAFEIKRDITLFELYSKKLESETSLVDSFQGPIFETFRTNQIKTLQPEHALPNGSWYLYEVQSEVDQPDQDSCIDKKTNADATDSGDNAKRNMVKIEFHENTMNTMAGTFLRELL